MTHELADHGESPSREPTARIHASGSGPPVSLESSGANSEDFTTEIVRRLTGRGKSYDRYEVKSEIARGGQGAVLRVWDEDLRRDLAMKVVLEPGDRTGDTPDSSSRALGRFLEEAQVTGQLDHPGIVPVHELGVDSAGRAYFTMKLVKGRDLRAILQLVDDGEEGWTRTRALNVLLKVCEAMAYAHSKGVIHRDLKPSNIMVGRYGEVLVMDWGLARILGSEDRRDVRIRQPDASKTLELRSLRHEQAESSASTLVTLDGDVLGTPAYMSPEQATGQLERMGPHSDVYSAGAMLYELLAGTPPYSIPGHVRDNRTVWLCVQDGPPKPLHLISPDVPPELTAICEKAMARDPARRYADMEELADDLRAYLEHRVVGAYATGAVAELQKWVVRNRTLALAAAAVVVALLLGLTASLILKGQSDRNAALAAERELLALEQSALARRERDNVLRLSAFQLLEDLESEADELWPPWPENLARYESWLARARTLAAGLDPAADGDDVGHRRRLAELEVRALTRSPAEREEARRSHARFDELALSQARLAALELANAVRAGERTPKEVVLAPNLAQNDAPALDALARPLVDPGRTRFGDEARGLALARLALEQAADDREYLRCSLTLAWALHAVGLDDEADAEIETARSVLGGELPPEEEREARRLAEAIRASANRPGDELEALRAGISDLEVEIAEHRTWHFAAEEDRWWHARLLELVADIEAFADPTTGRIAGVSAEEGWGIERRRDWAATIAERTVTGIEAARRWGAAIVSIRDRRECPQYDGLAIEPQLGLVPIGRDPHSGLWEFAHPLTGDVPVRDDAGELVLEETTGLVFVLVPGGSFSMGAQTTNPSAANHDPIARRQEGPVHRVALGPYFLSKYELTQAQWQRFTGVNPSFHQPPSRASSLLHPVEQVNWFDCVRELERMGLDLPTEAQWEYAARAETTTPWSTGRERAALEGAANLADQSVRAAGIPWSAVDEWPELDDGFTWHAPVGSFAANPFGLHDVHGNLWEWCLDGFDPAFYRRSPGVDPRCEPELLGTRANRGGSFYNGASSARSAARNSSPPEYLSNITGLRPARALTLESP